MNKRSIYILNYLLLLPVLILSFLSFWDFEFFSDKPLNLFLKYLGVFAPGIAFSLFLLFIFRKKNTWLRSILYFPLLLGIYYGLFSLCMLTWGLFLPVAGGLGALIIKKMFIDSRIIVDKKGSYFLNVGILAGSAGLVFYYLSIDALKVGTSFGVILVLWQLLIGLLCVRSSQAEEKKTNLNLAP